jgi:hypothetical protein
MVPWVLPLEALWLKMELWRVCSQVVADSHHFVEGWYPDLD